MAEDPVQNIDGDAINKECVVSLDIIFEDDSSDCDQAKNRLECECPSVSLWSLQEIKGPIFCGSNYQS